MSLVVEPGKKETKLPAIMKSALRLFVDRGIEGATTKEIARRAKVSEGALYRHFKGKEELAWYLFAKNLNHLSSELLATAMAGRSVRDRINNIVKYCLNSYERDPELFAYLLLSEHRELKKFASTYTSPSKVIERVVLEGQASGDLRRGSPELLAALILGTLHRLCALRAHGLLPKPVTRYAGEAAGLIFDSVIK